MDIEPIIQSNKRSRDEEDDEEENSEPPTKKTNWIIPEDE